MKRHARGSKVRDASTGRYVPPSEAERRPGETVSVGKRRRVQVLAAELPAGDGQGSGLYRLVARRGMVVLDLCSHAHEPGAEWLCPDAHARLAEGV